MHSSSQVIALDPDKKELTVKTDHGEEKHDYDKLLLSPGGYAPKPPFEGIDLHNVDTFRGPEDTAAFKAGMADTKHLVVIGSGYIGIEVATAYAQAGIDVLVIDQQERVLPSYLCNPMAERLEKYLLDKGIRFKGNETVKQLKGKVGSVSAVVTDQGEYPADRVLVAVGVKPGTDWLKDILSMDDRGFILVDAFLQTSAKDVYAGGDATYVPYAPTGKSASVALATIARRQGIVAALNAVGKQVKMPPVSGTSALKVFDYTLVSTGLSHSNLDTYDGVVESKYVEERVYPDFMRKEGSVYMNILFDRETHVILGGQLMSTFDVADSINVLSSLINAGYTLEQLALLDFFFQPNYDRPWHYLNVLAIEALGNTVGGADKLLF